jgi:hypothetical protein
MTRLTAAALSGAFVLLAAVPGSPQGGDPAGFDRLHRLDRDVPYLRDTPPREPLLPHGSLTPESNIPRRSPDLGYPFFPLTPSIGPGSGLLGPEGGRNPERLRSDNERDPR